MGEVPREISTRLDVFGEYSHLLINVGYQLRAKEVLPLALANELHGTERVALTKLLLGYFEHILSNLIGYVFELLKDYS